MIHIIIIIIIIHSLELDAASRRLLTVPFNWKVVACIPDG